MFPNSNQRNSQPKKIGANQTMVFQFFKKMDEGLNSGKNMATANFGINLIPGAINAVVNVVKNAPSILSKEFLNKDEQNLVERLLSYESKHKKNREKIIAHITKRFDAAKSDESNELLTILKDKNFSTQYKWDKLVDYMLKKEKDLQNHETPALLNNGKAVYIEIGRKLFELDLARNNIQRIKLTGDEDSESSQDVSSSEEEQVEIQNWTSAPGNSN